MKLELLERLLDAGFSKDEIIQLSRGDQGTAPDPDENQEYHQIEMGELVETAAEDNSSNQVEENESGKEKEAVDADVTNFGKRLEGIEKTMADLTKAIQAGNLRNDSFANPVESLEERTDKAMTEIIRPIRRERAI